MQVVDLKVGDTCWCYIGNHKGKMTKGTVVHILELDGWAFKNYVIEIPTAIDPLLEVRGPWSVSEHPRKPIGFHRKSLPAPPEAAR